MLTSSLPLLLSLFKVHISHWMLASLHAQAVNITFAMKTNTPLCRNACISHNSRLHFSPIHLIPLPFAIKMFHIALEWNKMRKQYWNHSESRVTFFASIFGIPTRFGLTLVSQCIVYKKALFKRITWIFHSYQVLSFISRLFLHPTQFLFCRIEFWILNMFHQYS